MHTFPYVEQVWLHEGPLLLPLFELIARQELDHVQPGPYPFEAAEQEASFDWPKQGEFCV